MLVVVKVETIRDLDVIKVGNGEEIEFKGVVLNLYRDDYIKELEDKAKGYDELSEIANKTIEAVEALLRTIK